MKTSPVHPSKAFLFFANQQVNRVDCVSCLIDQKLGYRINRS